MLLFRSINHTKQIGIVKNKIRSKKCNRLMKGGGVQ